MKMLKAICFDYYLTLVKMDDPYDQLKNWIITHLKKTYPEVNGEKFYGKFTRNRALITTKTEFNLSIDIHTMSLKNTCEFYGIPSFDENFRLFVEELFTSPEAYEDSHQVITELRKKYLVGLITNADNYILDQSLQQNDFSFDFVITSEDAKCYKPNRGIFLYAMQSLGFDPTELLMIGDSLMDDIYGAGNVNIATIWLNRKGQSLKEDIKPPLYNISELITLLDLIV